MRTAKEFLLVQVWETGGEKAVRLKSNRAVMCPGNGQCGTCGGMRTGMLAFRFAGIRGGKPGRDNVEYSSPGPAELYSVLRRIQERHDQREVLAQVPRDEKVVQHELPGLDPHDLHDVPVLQ